MNATSLIELPARVAKPRRTKRIRGAFLVSEETLAVLRAAKERSVRDWAMIKQALGHRSISSTMIYVGTTDSQTAEAVKAALMGVF